MKAIKIIFILVISIPIALVSFFYARNKIIGPEGWALDITKQKLQAMMKDPESMKIISSFTLQKEVDEDTTEIAICGIVDGKNSFGVYQGGQMFASLFHRSKKSQTFSNVFVQIEDPVMQEKAHRINNLSPFESVYWNVHCIDETHNPIKN